MTVIGWAAAEPRRLPRRRDSRHVGGDRAFERERDVRLDLGGGGPRAAQPELLRDGKARDERHAERLLGQRLERLHQHRAPGAVVERLPDDGVAAFSRPNG